MVVLRAVRIDRARGPWIVIGVGVSLYGAGNLVWALWLEHVASPPIPSICDALWLSFYPASYLGVVMLARQHWRAVPGGVWLDGIVAGLGIGAVGAAVVFGPVLRSTTGSVAAVTTNLAYPVSDLLLAGLVVGVLAVRGWRLDRMWALLGGASSLSPSPTRSISCTWQRARRPRAMSRTCSTWRASCCSPWLPGSCPGAPSCRARKRRRRSSFLPLARLSPWACWRTTTYIDRHSRVHAFAPDDPRRAAALCTRLSRPAPFQRGAQAGGHRRSHRASEPPPLPAASRGVDRAQWARRARDGGADRRSRPLQTPERHPGPSQRRRVAASDRAAAAEQAPSGRHTRTTWWR